MVVVFTGKFIVTPKLHGWLHTSSRITHSCDNLGRRKKKPEGSEITNFLHVPYIQTKETRMVSGEA